VTVTLRGARQSFHPHQQHLLGTRLPTLKPSHPAAKAGAPAAAGAVPSPQPVQPKSGGVAQPPGKPRTVHEEKRGAGG